MQAQDDFLNHFDVNSQMSSINQSLLDDQPSIAISQVMNDIERNSES